MTDNTPATTRRRRGRALALGTAAATAFASTLTLAPAAYADQQEPPTGAVSAAHGHGLFVDLAGLDLAASGTSHSAYDTDSWPESQSGGLDLSLLGLDVAAALGLSGGVNLPLVAPPGSEDPALLDLGNLDALVTNSASPSATSSTASSGLVGEGSSGINLDPNDVPADYAPTTLDASALLEQILGETITSTVLDEASIEIGALGAQASKVDSTDATRDYMVAGLEANVHSPLVGDLSGVLTGAVEQIVQPVNGLVGEGGLVNGVITDLSAVVDAVDLNLVLASVELNSDPEKSGATITGLDTLVTTTVNATCSTSRSRTPTALWLSICRPARSTSTSLSSCSPTTTPTSARARRRRTTSASWGRTPRCSLPRSSRRSRTASPRR